jgi:hypothetical protein
MQAALEILGYGPTIHGFNQWMHVQDTVMWEEGLKAKFFPSSSSSPPFTLKEFDQLLGDYEIASDFPSIAFAEELIELYPEAKVIIVERDVDAWYKSFYESIVAYIFSPVVYSIVALDRPLLSFHEMTRTWVRGKFQSNSKKELEGKAKIVYKEHYEMIRKVTPKERLLDFKLGDGWEPLCEFLGKEVPKGIEFPRINDKEDFKRRSNIMLKIAAGRVLKRGLWPWGDRGAAA